MGGNFVYCINLAVNSDIFFQILQTKVATLSLPAETYLLHTTSHNDSSNQNLGLDAAGCITLLIFLPPLIISICFPGLKVNLPSRFVHAFRRTRSSSVSPTRAPPANGLHPELRDTLNYRGRPHAAPVVGAVMAVFVYARQMHARRLFFITVARK